MLICFSSQVHSKIVRVGVAIKKIYNQQFVFVDFIGNGKTEPRLQRVDNFHTPISAGKVRYATRESFALLHINQQKAQGC